MAAKNLREWIKYVEQSTLPDQQSRPTPLASQGTASRSTAKPAGTKAQRRPDSWDLVEGKAVTSPMEAGEADRVPTERDKASESPQAIAGDARPSPLHVGEWVGEPRPKPTVAVAPRHRQAAMPANPIKAPRIRKSKTLTYLLDCLPTELPPFPGEPCGVRDDNGDAEQSRLFQRLTNPELTLRETALLLNVCPTTVRRYTNSGILSHHRGAGNHRRFQLRAVLSFARQYSDKRKDPKPAS